MLFYLKSESNVMSAPKLLVQSNILPRYLQNLRFLTYCLGSFKNVPPSLLLGMLILLSHQPTSTANPALTTKMALLVAQKKNG